MVFYFYSTEFFGLNTLKSTRERFQLSSHAFTNPCDLIRRFSDSLGVNFVKIYSNLPFSLWAYQSIFKVSRWNYVIRFGLGDDAISKIKIFSAFIVYYYGVTKLVNSAKNIEMNLSFRKSAASSHPQWYVIRTNSLTFFIRKIFPWYPGWSSSYKRTRIQQN